MARNHTGFNSNYLPPSDSLEMLYNPTCRANRLFIALNRPWVSGSGEIQKACAYYLLHAVWPKKSRDVFMHVMGDIAYSVYHLSACSDFIAQKQIYYHNQGKIPYLYLSGKVLYKESDLERVLEKAYCKAGR